MINDIAALLRLSNEKKASDLHLTPDETPVMRIDGVLTNINEHPVLHANKIKEMIYHILDKEQQHAFESSLELDFGITLENAGRFRANIFHHANGVSGIFRVIPIETPELQTLGAPPVLKDILELSSGLILVTGPTGCGKTTTLAAMLDYINRTQRRHIITIEDPIEYVHVNKKSLIHQRQVNRDTTSFAAALRSALREDPDVILVGEMRDLETMRLALTAAETGHLVMATLHTSSAPRAVSRIIDAFPANEKNIIRNLVSESLQAVICQTLVNKNSGGRVAAFEIMLGTPAIRNLIREDKIAQMYSVMQTSARVGMRTMEQAVSELTVA